MFITRTRLAKKKLAQAKKKNTDIFILRDLQNGVNHFFFSNRKIDKSSVEHVKKLNRSYVLCSSSIASVTVHFPVVPYRCH